MPTPSVAPLLAGQPLSTPDQLAVLNPWNGETVGTVGLATWPHIDAALTAAQQALPHTSRLPAWQRHDILQKTVALLGTNADALASLICAEAGKPLALSQAEVRRAQAVFSFAAAYARTAEDQLLALDHAPGLEGRRGLVRRVPVGVLLAISPFNFPLNLVAHKLAPAILAGMPFVLKPASKTPLTALRLGQILLEAGWPAEALHVLPFSASLGNQAVTDPRVAMVSFTGSPEVGWNLKRQAADKRVALELGGDAAAIVCPDADLPTAARKLAAASFAYAGQVCISVQRILVHQSVADTFTGLFEQEVARLVVGNPASPDTVVGPLIDRPNYLRTLQWIEEARQGGARLVGGQTLDDHNTVAPAILYNLPDGCHIAREEAFAPIVAVSTFQQFDDALTRVNASRYGLQTGLFTHDERYIRAAWDTLHVGGIIVNDAPTLRIDNMPYGGVKHSGFGREGVHYAYEEMTEPRLLVW